MTDQSKDTKDAKDKRNDYLTASQLAKVLQISEASVHRLRRQGRIPALKLTPRLIRFNLKDVRAALAEPPTPTPHTIEENSQQLAFDDLFMENF